MQSGHLPGKGFLTLLTSAGAAGLTLRLLLPGAILCSALLGWMCLQGQRLGLLGAASGIALLVVTQIAMVAFVAWRLALSLERADRKRRRADELFQLAVKASPNAVFMANANGIIVLANEQLEKSLRYSSGELLGKSIDLLVPERYRPRHERLRKTYLEQPTALSHPYSEPLNAGREITALRRDGSEIPIEIRLSSARLEDETLVLASVIDLSARRLAEERFLATFEQGVVGIAHVSPEGKWLRVNQKLCDILGQGREELLSQSIQSLVQPEAQSAGPDFMEQLLSGALQVHSCERRTCRPSGVAVWIHLTATLVRTPAGAPDYFLAVIEDVSRRRQAEEKLTTAEARLLSLSESNIIGFVVGDYEGHIADANPAFLNMLGYTREEVLRRKIRWTDLTAPEYRELDRRALEQLRSMGAAHPWEKEFICKDGVRIHVLIGLSLLKGSVDTYIAFVLDLSDRKQLEDQLRQAQRMEVIGRLAGGVAHDFNNLLTPIIGYSALILAQMSPSAPFYEDLAEVHKAGQRASVLTRQLLAFSRKQVLQPKETELNALVRDASKLLRPLLGSHVNLVLALAEQLRLVKVDAGQIEQALMNLAANARDAMPHGGTLTIETANVDLSESYVSTHPDITPGRYTVLTVSDTGVGMSKEVVSHLFEPFYTTKERGRGTGLGLATVHGIVKQNQGHIWVYSELERGSTFKLYFPVSDGELAAEVKEVKPPPSASGTERILLVEDEAPLRALGARVLREKGYQVLEAENGERALALAKSHQGPLELLITDVIMPGLSGGEVADQIVAMRPTIKVLFISGYTENSIVHHGVLDQGRELLDKPFTPDSLLRRVRAILDGQHYASPAVMTG